MTLRLNGSSSGYTEIDAPAAAGSNTLTLPTSNGSANQFLKNSGTAGELEYSSMIEDSSGNVKIAAGSNDLRVGDDIDSNAGTQTISVGSVTSGSGGIGIFANPTNGNSFIQFGDGSAAAAQYRGYLNYQHANDYLIFGVAAENRMRFDSDGLLRAYADNSVIHAYTASGASGTKNLYWGGHSATNVGGSGATNTFVVRTNGNVGNTNNDYGSLSDVKLKENIVDATSQWEDIKGIRVRKYNFKEETGHETFTQLGVIAQEVETVSPGLITEAPDLDEQGNDLGTVTKSVSYSVLYMKAVKALQEAQTRIETLETKVAALEAAE